MLILFLLVVLILIGSGQAAPPSFAVDGQPVGVQAPTGALPLMIRWSQYRPEFGQAVVYAREQDMAGMLSMGGDVVKMIMVVEEQEAYRLLSQVDQLKAGGVIALGFNPEGGHTPAAQMDTLNNPSPEGNVVARVCRAAVAAGLGCVYGPIRVQLDNTSAETIAMLRENGVRGIALQEQKFIETQPATERVAAIQATLRRWPGFSYHVQIMQQRCPDMAQCKALAQALPGLGVTSLAIWGPVPVEFVEELRR